MEEVQLTGAITLDGTTVSDQVFRLIIVTARPVTWKPGTAGAPPKPKAGLPTATVQIDLATNENDATGVHAILAAAQLTASAEVPFTGVLRPGPVSPTNKKWSGILVVAALETGGTPGETKVQSQVYPAYDVVTSES